MHISITATCESDKYNRERYSVIFSINQIVIIFLKILCTK